MISVVIPTLNAAETLHATLDQFKNSPVQEIIVVDGGSSDATAEIARAIGARVVESEQGRGAQLRAGAEAAGTDWMLFLHADTKLGPGWQSEVGRFVSSRDNALRGAVFRFAVDDKSEQAHRLERMVAWRNRVLDLPYGDQGLLIHRVLYDIVGGFQPLPLMEDVDFMRRLKGRFILFDAPAITSARRFRESGYLRRSTRNLFCLALYFLGVSPQTLVRLYN